MDGLETDGGQSLDLLVVHEDVFDPWDPGQQLHERRGVRRAAQEPLQREGDQRLVGPAYAARPCATTLRARGSNARWPTPTPSSSSRP